jgi:hypothetical protein
VLAGCGGGSEKATTRPTPPRIPAGVADRLAAAADRVAGTQGCAAREVAVAFRSDVIAQIGRVPARYQEQLTSAANDLVDRIPPCPQPTNDDNQDEGEHGHGRHGKHKHKKEPD